MKQCIWLTSYNALSFDVNSVAETLTTHTYQELAFSGPNNDFIAHNNPSSIMFITALQFLPHVPHGVAACSEYCDRNKNETRDEKLFITASAMGFGLLCHLPVL